MKKSLLTSNFINIISLPRSICINCHVFFLLFNTYDYNILLLLAFTAITYILIITITNIINGKVFFRAEKLRQPNCLYQILRKYLLL